MSLLEIRNLTHSYGEQVLYRDVDLDFYKGEHVGIVGANGAGKTTLVNIFTGSIVPDIGFVRWQNNVRAGYLDQYAEVDGGISIQEYFESSFSELYEAERRLNAYYEQLGFRGADTESIYGRIERAQAYLEENDFYNIGSAIAKVATGLGIDALGMDTRLSELSGGQRAKCILAKLLIEKPAVLVLDEPTNYLDKEHVSWLAATLRDFRGSTFVVSHDTGFLDIAVSTICDVEFGRIKKYGMKYSEFIKLKEKQREEYVRQYNIQQEKIKETEEFIRRNIAGIKSKMARGRRTRLEKLERMEKPNFNAKIHIKISMPPPAASPVLVVKELLIGYARPLLPPVSFALGSGERIAVTGFNGVGKSTLLKTLTGRIMPLGGSFRFSDTAVKGYFEQELHWENVNMTPVNVISEAYPQFRTEAIRRQLTGYGITKDHLWQGVGTLSGGEQTRIKLCSLFLTPANVLILDEPTNHLDADAKQELKDALLSFEGSLILVTHEKEFYEGLVDRIVELR